MQIYFENNTKYIRVSNFAIEYSEAKRIFKQIYPNYIETFKGIENNIANGFDRFIGEYDGLVEALTTDEISGVFILFKLTTDIFPEFEKLTKRKRVIKSEHTSTEWQLKLLEFDYCCAYCGKTSAKLEKDHICPVSKGGSDKIDNIVPSCRRCNASKYNKVLPR